MSEENDRSSDVNDDSSEGHDDFDEEISPPNDDSSVSDEDVSERTDEDVSADEVSGEESQGSEDSDVRSEEVGFDLDELGMETVDDKDADSVNSTRERRRKKYEEEKDDEPDEDEEEEETIDEEEILVETDEDKEEQRQEEADKVTSAEFEWRAEAEQAWEKVQIWRDGSDEDVSKDVRTAPSRAKKYFLRNRSARDYLVDIVLPLTLTVYGFLLLVASFIAAGQGGLFEQVMVEPHRIADLFLLDTVLMLLAAVGFVLARRWTAGSESSGDMWRRRLRLFVIGLHLLPTLVFFLLVWNFIQPGIVEEWAVWFYDWQVYLDAIVPQGLASLGEAVWDATPIGVTVQYIAAVMFFAGLVASIPFALGIAKVIIVAINTEAEREMEAVDALNLTGPTTTQRASSREGRIATQTGSRGDAVEEGGTGPFDNVAELFEPSDDYKIEPYPGYEEHKRYWVNKPYAYVVILYDDRNSDYRYYVVEPQKTHKEDAIYEELNQRLSQELLYENVEERIKGNEDDERRIRTRILEDKALEIAREYNISINDKSFQKIMYYLRRDYVDYGKIDPMMQDPNSEDISCDGDNREIFLFHQEYEDLLTNIKFETEELRSFIIQLAQRSGEHISAADPMCDASLPDGSRAQLTLGDEVTDNGSTFTLRIFQDVPFTPIDLISTETFNIRQIAYLWLCIEHDMSLIFAGGTASGKTTTMNAISLFIPPKSKIVSLEDTRELTLPHSNWVPSVTRESFGGEEIEEIDMYNLLEAALRQRPEYLLVGEVRGEEAQSLFQAMSTGHTTYSTMHADSVDSAVYRLTNPPINVPEEMIQALDILCIQNQVNIEDPETGEVERVRRNEKIGEIERQKNTFRVSDAYHRDAQRDAFVEDIEDSQVLENIRGQQGWTHEELARELSERQQLLKYMVEEEYDSLDEVTRIVQAYMVNSKRVMNMLEDDSLHPSEFDDIEAIETFDDEVPDAVLPHELEQDVIGRYS